MIYIDASRYSNIKNRTGVENYSFFIINELVKINPEEITLISPKKISIEAKQITIPFPRLWTQVRLSWEIFKNKKINNLFVPSHLLPIIHPKNSTLTIHDVAWKHTPESYGWKSRIYLEWGTRFAVKRAKKIITVSETTKKDLIKFYKAKKEKIHIVPLGFSIPKKEVKNEESSKIISDFNLKEEKYFLYIGRIETKKGTDTLIKAFNEIKKNHPDLKLVLVGKNGKNGEKILKQINKELRMDGVTTGYIDEKGKQALLKNALCFVFPSRYEGFGLPLLEAMYYRRPIIASSIPTSHEIAGKNALFFKTSNEKDLKEKMEKMLMKKEFREKMIQNYTETLKRYSWEKSAKIIFKLLNC